MSPRPAPSAWRPSRPGSVSRAGTRVEFVCGGRALQGFRDRRDALASASKLMSVAPSDVPCRGRAPAGRIARAAPRWCAAERRARRAPCRSAGRWRRDRRARTPGARGRGHGRERAEGVGLGARDAPGIPRGPHVDGTSGPGCHSAGGRRGRLRSRCPRVARVPLRRPRRRQARSGSGRRLRRRSRSHPRGSVSPAHRLVNSARRTTIASIARSTMSGGVPKLLAIIAKARRSPSAVRT